MATKHDVIRLNAEHPDWTSRQIADEINACDEYVRATAYRCELKLGKAPNRTKRMEGDTIDELGRAARKAGLTVKTIRAMKRGRPVTRPQRTSP
jgi:hypothetical protein